jgi:hypothetical protein
MNIKKEIIEPPSYVLSLSKGRQGAEKSDIETADED